MSCSCDVDPPDGVIESIISNDDLDKVGMTNQYARGAYSVVVVVVVARERGQSYYNNYVVTDHIIFVMSSSGIIITVYLLAMTKPNNYQ